MRGKGVSIAAIGQDAGITPAYAGKSWTTLLCPNSSRDHPRVCGEKYQLENQDYKKVGSPPRMRGKVVPPPLLTLCSGITPAYAGKRLPVLLRYERCQDHPRVCGEKRQVQTAKMPRKGSPPRMRGKAKLTGRRWQRRGITPAYAGKRSAPCRHSLPRQDHPRVCGEKRGETHCGETSVGSPPRMRGKEDPRWCCSTGGGITPAYAGKRQLVRLSPTMARDHPRVCGEKKSTLV